MFGDSISASDAFWLGFVSHLVPADRLRQENRCVGDANGDRSHPRLRGHASHAEGLKASGVTAVLLPLCSDA
jgi:enoyl-CoA hydratase/carnithine racemase